MVNIISKKTLWVSISGVLIAASIVMVGMWGLKLGIDFTGGSLLEVKYLGVAPTVTEVEEKLAGLNLKSLTAQPTEQNGMIIRFQDTSEETHQAILKELPPHEELRFEAVGPSIGQELQRKAIIAILLVLLTISLYMAWAFRKVSRPVASWKYGVVTLISLFHDVVIVLGLFAFLGHFYGVEVNTPFIAAVLTVLGFSVHDTIVVFDRIRENLPRSAQDFAGTVNASLNQTIVRSINTSITVMLVLAAIVFLGGATITHFALALLVGIFFGTYSSIFLASPLLVFWDNFTRRNQ